MLCNTFKRLAFDTWNLIAKSRRANNQAKNRTSPSGFKIGEETITDINMLELILSHPNQVITTTFNKKEEGKNGADWEWWFVQRNRWIGFRVQAKILEINTDTFEHLHYNKAEYTYIIDPTTNKTIGRKKVIPEKRVFQCNKLIQDALRTIDQNGSICSPKIPIYCLYLQTDDPTRLKRKLCLRELWGCSLLNAFQVKKIQSENINADASWQNPSEDLTKVESHLRPWHWLVCYSANRSGDKITNINDYAKKHFGISETDIVKNKELIKDLKELINGEEEQIQIPDDFITENPPTYVTEILEGRYGDEAPDPELHGVMIYNFDKE
jgi:hypothetical protein